MGPTSAESGTKAAKAVIEAAGPDPNFVSDTLVEKSKKLGEQAFHATTDPGPMWYFCRVSGCTIPEGPDSAL